MRIIHKFLATLLSIGLLVATVGYFVAVKGQQALTAMIGHEQVDLTASLIHNVDQVIYSRIEILEFYAHHSKLAIKSQQSNKLFAKQTNLDEYIDGIDRDWKENRNTPFIRSVLSTPLSIEFAELVADYKEEYGYPVFSEIFLTNQYGVVIASSSRTSDYLQADEEWYQQALAEEEVWVGQAEYDKSSDTFGSDIVINLYDDAGNHVGQLKAVLNISDSIRTIQRTHPTAHHQAKNTRLITSKGEVLFSTADEKPGQPVSQAILSGFENQANGTDFFVGSSNQEGEMDTLFTHAKSLGHRDFKSLGWILVIEHKLDDILGPAVAVRNNIQRITVFTFLVIALLGIAISRSLSRPLQQLKKASTAIGKGQLDTRVDIRSNDELGMLASTLNNMAERLQHTTVSQSYLDNIIESMMDSLVVLSPQGEINKVNQITLDILNYQEQELLGQPIGSIFAEADDENMPLKGKGIENLFNRCLVHNVEKNYLTKDGRKIPVLFSSAVMRDDNDSIQGVVCAALDISERKLAEQELQEKSMDLSERVKELNCLFAMAQVIETPGLSEYEICARVVRIIPMGWRYPEITCAVITLDGKTFNSREFKPTPWVQSVEIQIHGIELGKIEVFYLEQRPTQHEGPFTREERALLNHLAAQLTKTFEKIALDNAVRDSEERNRLLLDSSSDGIYAIDMEGACTICNPAAAQMLGYESPEQVIGKNAHALFHHTRPDGSHYPQKECSIQKGYEEETFLDNEIFWRVDGSTLPVECRVAPMKRDGKTVGSVVSFTDMTKRRTTELQLRQAQKLESIGQLAAGIAHEINTPTQFVSDNTTFLSEAFQDYKKLIQAYEHIRHIASTGEVSEDTLKAVDELAEEMDIEFLNDEIPQAIKQSQEGLGRITKIVRAMKEFSHPGVEEKTPIDINKALETTINVSRNEWRYHCDIKTSFEPDLPQVPCLPDEINQVFLNLIVNAAHAIADVGCNSGGMGVIQIVTRQDGDWVEIAVSDTGSGIPEKIRQRIFDPFFTTKEVGKGTGQGLAIVYSAVVDKHKGTIKLESEEGKGTTFIIRLPIETGTES